MYVLDCANNVTSHRIRITLPFMAPSAKETDPQAFVYNSFQAG